MERAIRILIADDHGIVREGLRSVLGPEPDMEVLGEAATGKEVVEWAAELRPDVILMDIQMPQINGIEATRRILDTTPDVGVVVLTMFEDDDSVFSAMRAGARGYVLKGAPPSEILKVLRAVARGEAYFGPEIARRLMDFFSAPRFASPQESFPELTTREREILDLIAQGHTNAKIAGRLFLSPRTVGNHISHIFTKLQVADRSHAIIRAREAGLGRQMFRDTLKHAFRLGMLWALALTVSACSGSGGDQQQAKEQARGRPLPKYEQASLPNGKYHPEEFEPSLSFRLTGGGWRFEGPSGTLGDPERPDYLFIENAPAEIAFLNLRKVKGLSDPTGPPGAMDPMPAPDELVGWFQRHPYLKTSKPEPTTVGGAKGVQFDAVVENLPKGHIALGGTNTVDIVKLSTGGSAEIHEGYKLRYIVLTNVKGTPVLIYFNSLIADFDEFEPKAEKVLHSVKWTGS